MIRHSKRLRATYFRLWIGSYSGPRPRSWRAVPERFVPLEPVGAGCCSAGQALAYLEGFNRQMFADPARRWAVAVPISLRFDGDATTRQPLIAPTQINARPQAGRVPRARRAGCRSPDERSVR